MLRLKRIEVEGFGPFADRQVVDLPPQPGVTVIYGENMRGKTRSSTPFGMRSSAPCSAGGLARESSIRFQTVNAPPKASTAFPSR